MTRDVSKFVEEIARVASMVRRFYPHPPEWIDTVHLTPADRSLYKAAFDRARTLVWNVRWPHILPANVEITEEKRTRVLTNFQKLLVVCLYRAYMEDGYKPDFEEERPVWMSSHWQFARPEGEQEQEPEDQQGPAACQSEEATEGQQASPPEGQQEAPEEAGASEISRFSRSISADLHRVIRMAVLADAYLAYAILRHDAESPRMYNECGAYVFSKAVFMRSVFPGLCSITMQMIQDREFHMSQFNLLNPGAQCPDQLMRDCIENDALDMNEAGKRGLLAEDFLMINSVDVLLNPGDEGARASHLSAGARASHMGAPARVSHMGAGARRHKKG